MTEVELFKKAQTYVGLPWSTDFDCADLAMRVHAELFGLRITLPSARPSRVEREGSGLMAQMSACVARRVGHPKTGTVALFSEQIGRAKRWHIGTVFMRPGRTHEPWVLHSDEARNTQFQPMADLLTHGLDLDGFYEWKTPDET